MKIETRSYSISMTLEEQNLLLQYIEHYFTGTYEVRSRLFDEINDTIAIMQVAGQLQHNCISLIITGYQAKLITNVIYNNEKRWNIKTNSVYLPKEFKGRKIYDCFDKIADK